MHPEEKQRIFETTELPTLIKNLNVPSMDITYSDGKTAFYFKREGANIILYKRTMDILQKHSMENEIFAFLFDEAKNQKIFIADDNNIKFYIRDVTLDNGERKFSWIHYHGFTENLSKELKEVFKNFSDIDECYGVAEAYSYYFVSIKSLSDNKELIDATAPIVRKHLPEGVTWKFLTFDEGTSIENELRSNDYEKLL